MVYIGWSIFVEKSLCQEENCLLSVAGGTQRLTRVVGPSVAKELIFTGRIIDGIEARDIGLVNHTVPQNDDGDAAFVRSLELAREIAPQVLVLWS